MTRADDARARKEKMIAAGRLSTRVIGFGAALGVCLCAAAPALAQAPKKTVTQKTNAPRMNETPKPAPPRRQAPQTPTAKKPEDASEPAAPRTSPDAARAPVAAPQHLAPTPAVDTSAPPPSLPRASRERMRACAEEWEGKKRATKVGLPMWRDFATECLKR